MRTTTKAKINTHFEGTETSIFWPSDLSNLVRDYRQEWAEFDLSVQQVLKFLLKDGLLRKAKFSSERYPPIVRYVRGDPSPHELAVALRRDSFLCHKTALNLHGLGPLATTIYVNKEQGAKAATTGITQQGINRAFKSRQRHSNYVFQYGGSQYVLISGKNTGRAGVVRVTASDGATIDATDLERTLIDIAVRPAYAGGMNRVLSAYKEAQSKVDIDHLIEMLHKLNYAYPYHQAIGFLLERSGLAVKECERFKRLGLQFDFYLDYDIKDPVYDRNWRLYFPSFLR